MSICAIYRSCRKTSLFRAGIVRHDGALGGGPLSTAATGRGLEKRQIPNAVLAQEFGRNQVPFSSASFVEKMFGRADRLG